MPSEKGEFRLTGCEGSLSVPHFADLTHLDMIRCFEVFLFEEMQSKIEVNMARKKNQQKNNVTNNNKKKHYSL